MKLKFLAAVILLSVLVSCKKENKEKNAAPEVAIKENFTVEIDATVPAKDDFAVYYTEDGTIDFSGEKAVWSGISGGPVAEKVIIQLPETIVPTAIRLDFGMNKEQGNVTIEHIKMIYQGKSFEFKGSDFFTYFIKSEEFNTEIDAAKGTVTIVKGNEGFKTPYFYPTPFLAESIAKITAAK